jgi:hypothetical protein
MCALFLSPSEVQSRRDKRTIMLRGLFIVLAVILLPALYPIGFFGPEE